MKNDDTIRVSELIEILNKYPKDMVVVTDGYESGYENILYPGIIDVILEPENMYFDGEYQNANDKDKNKLEVLAIRRNKRWD
ncbi:MAG: hypothetical protein ABIA04_15280 [Pseudomonadota bacterium]